MSKVGYNIADRPIIRDFTYEFSPGGWVWVDGCQWVGVSGRVWVGGWDPGILYVYVACSHMKVTAS